jgi:DNA primase
MQMLKKIFNSDSKYYLELNEIEESKPVQAAIKTAEKVIDVVQDKTTEILESKPVEQAAQTAKQATNIAQDKLQSATTTKVKPQRKTKASSGKTSKKDTIKSEQKAPTEVKAAVKKSGASSFDPPFWVAAMYDKKATETNSNGTPIGSTFATDNLMPTVTKYRRRPGPSLNKFRDMASKTRTPRV